MQKIKKPTVSVVIATYNRAQELRRCLDSLIKQTFEDFEVLICDDGSTDNTAQVVEEYLPYLDIIYDHSQNFGGPARPRNAGIRLSRAPYIAFLDSDDWWMPQKLEESVKYLQEGADLVYHDLFIARQSCRFLFWKKARTRQVTTPVFKDLLVNGNAINNSSVVVKRSLLDTIGGLSEDRDLIAAEDYDAWLQISKITEKFKRIPKSLGYYWEGGGNISNPERTLSLLKAIESRYSQAFHDSGNETHWLNYVKGRCYYLLGYYELAKSHLKMLQMKSVLIYLKSKWMVFVMKFCKSNKMQIK